MSKHVSLKELSAHLDGQARGAGRIQQHLQQCPECARVYSELENVQGFLRKTPQEEVGPGFAARVMCAVREEAQPSKGWERRYPWALAASAAVVALCAGLAMFAMWAAVVALCAGLAMFAMWAFEEAHTPRTDQEIASDLDSLVLAWLDEMEEMHMEEERHQDQFLDELAYLDILLTMAADPELEEAMLVYEDEPHVDELVETLDEESADIFVELLATYDQGAWTP